MGSYLTSTCISNIYNVPRCLEFVIENKKSSISKKPDKNSFNKVVINYTIFVVSLISMSLCDVMNTQNQER